MAIKTVEVPDFGTVHLYKRKGLRNMRLSLTHKGAIRVSMPTWVPYRLGLEFALSKRSWITSKQKKPVILEHGQAIGKSHYLSFIGEPSRQKVTTRITRLGEIRILLPVSSVTTSEMIQASARRACVRALRTESEAALPHRLCELASLHGFSYKSVSIKQLSSRWGSCSEQKNIVLNCYLMQLPWHLIDYVILHELVHTKVMAHGPRFWEELIRYVPNLPQIRKEIKQYQPTIIPG